MTTEKEDIRFYRSSGRYGWLSNLYPREIEFEGKRFRSAEDAYQYGKPLETSVADWLISAPKPHLCAMTAHALPAFDIRPGWNDIKVDRMREVLKAKFSQHTDLMTKLILTGDAALIEDSKTDAFWGIGKKDNGKNMLGVLLMEIREELFKKMGFPESFDVVETIKKARRIKKYYKAEGRPGGSDKFL